MRLLLIRHRLAFLLALMIGAIYMSHHAFMTQALFERGQKYVPVTVAGNRDEAGYYALRVHAAYEGDLIVGDVNLYEYQDTPAYLPIGNPILMAGVARLAGSLERGFMLADFVFPALIFLVVYAIAYECVRSRLGSLLFASIFLIMPKFALFPSAGALPFFSAPYEFYFSRFEYPQVTFFFFGLTLYLMLRTFLRREQWMPLAAGASFGLLFYTYLYDWMYVGTALFLLTLVFLFERNWDQLRRASVLFGTAVLVSVPYWINLFAVIHLPSYGDLLVRLGMEVGHQFRVEIVWPSYVRATVLTLAAWFLLGRTRHTLRIFLASLVLPVFVLLNLQIVTGIMPQPDHWHRTQFFALALAVLAIGYYSVRPVLIRLSAFVIRSGVLISISAVLVFGIWSQYTMAHARAESYSLDPTYLEAYTWIREHDPHSVVATLDPTTNHELVIYADAYLFLPSGFNTIAPTEEIWHRATLLARLLGMSTEDFLRYVRTEQIYLFTDTYLDKSFNSYFRPEKRDIPVAVLEQRTAYLESIMHDTVLSLPYRLDYLLIGPRETPWLTELHVLDSSLEPVFQTGGVTIYRYYE